MLLPALLSHLILSLTLSHRGRGIGPLCSPGHPRLRGYEPPTSRFACRVPLLLTQKGEGFEVV